jgi:hypothetical protein
MSKAIVASFLSVLTVAPAWGQQPERKTPSPQQPAREKDHRLMMQALGITALRPGPSANRNAPNATNYDESKVVSFTLPDPLVCKDGSKVTSPEQWWNKRRPETVEDFDREVYGRVPKDVPSVKWEVTKTKEEKIGPIPAITRRVVGHVEHSRFPEINVEIQLILTTPANARGPVPVMMEFGFDPDVPFRPPGRLPANAQAKDCAPKGAENAQKKATPKAAVPGGFAAGQFWKRLVLTKGWGCAIVVPNSIQADNGAPKSDAGNK